MNKPTIVCILGMHRSGTSLLARILNLLGVDLGPEAHLVSPAAANPKGFWEHRPIVKVNQAIFNRLKVKSYYSPEFTSQWENSFALDDLRAQALEIVKQDFENADLWGWKDPRTCLTLPFWQKLLPPMKYVFCLRNPVEVARSLERRDGLALEKGIYFWLVYMKHALEHTAVQQRIFLNYTSVMEDRRELRRLSEFIGKPERAEHRDVQEAIQNFIDKSLRHHHAPMLDADKADESNARSQAIYKAQRVYAELAQDGQVEQTRVAALIQEALDLISLEIIKQKQKEDAEWKEKVDLAMQEIERVIPPIDSFILADEEQLGTNGYIAERRRIPFMESNGQYWGLPPNGETAISEVERLQQTGANYFVLAWTAFQWFDYYPELHQYLRSKFPCILESERLIVFDLN